MKKAANDSLRRPLELCGAGSLGPGLSQFPSGRLARPTGSTSLQELYAIPVHRSENVRFVDGRDLSRLELKKEHHFEESAFQQLGLGLLDCPAPLRLIDAAPCREYVLAVKNPDENVAVRCMHTKDLRRLEVRRRGIERVGLRTET